MSRFRPGRSDTPGKPGKHKAEPATLARLLHTLDITLYFLRLEP
jgi:hypothetical protein